MKYTGRIPSLLLAPALLMPVAMTSLSAQAELTAGVTFASKYILRGIVEENSGTAMQVSLDYAHGSGFYAGWWASNLSYTYDKTGADAYTTQGFENDFYAGYAGSIGDFTYNIGLIQFYYINVDDSSLPELVLGAGYGPFSVQAQYLLADGWWGNAGDTYFTANYSGTLVGDLGLGVSLGYYLYDDDDAGNSKASFVTTEDSAFRHLNLTLTHPLADSGFDLSVTYIIAGEDRGGNEYDDTMVLSVSRSFDL